MDSNGRTGAGVFNIAIKVTDSGGLLDSQVFSVQVDEVNEPPVLSSIGDQNVNEEEELTFTAMAADPDVPANALIFSLDAGAPVGAEIDAITGVFTWTPTEEQGLGAYGITIRVRDDEWQDFETITITVNEVNKAPVLTSIGDRSINEGEELTFIVAGMDADVPIQTLLFSATNIPEGATFNPDTRTFRWIPTEAQGPGNFNFTFAVSDDELTDEETVRIDVAEVNVAPVATDDSATTPEDTPVTVAVLGNDTDVDGNTLSISSVTQAANGSVAVNPDHTLTYDPSLNFFGTDSFTYTASDGQGGIDTATVNVIVTAVNDAPVAWNESYNTTENIQLTVPLIQGVLANDTDVENDPLTAVVVDGPAHGTLALNPDGGFIYTPTANYFGPDGFTYKASDGQADSNVATVAITVIAEENQPPVAPVDTYSTEEDTPLTVGASSGVLANDDDPNGETLTATVVDGPVHGTLTLNNDGSFTYDPDANYNGTDSFTYKANDRAFYSNAATVNLTIDPINDAPTLGIITDQNVVEKTELRFTATATDPDLPGDVLTFNLDGEAQYGATIDSVSGVFSWTPTEA